MFNKEHAKFLNISDDEKKVLLCIRKIPKNIFNISEDTDIPRATVYLIIKKLYSRGFVKVGAEGKRYIYKTISAPALKQKLEEVISKL